MSHVSFTDLYACGVSILAGIGEQHWDHLLFDRVGRHQLYTTSMWRLYINDSTFNNVANSYWGVYVAGGLNVANSAGEGRLWVTRSNFTVRKQKNEYPIFSRSLILIGCPTH
jgi:hypothetical protein